MKCLILENTSGFISCFYFFIPFLMKRHHFIGNLSEEAPFYLANLGGGWGSFLFMSKTMLEVGWSFILWSML